MERLCRPETDVNAERPASSLPLVPSHVYYTMISNVHVPVGHDNIHFCKNETKPKVAIYVAREAKDTGMYPQIMRTRKICGACGRLACDTPPL